ncbi:MAG TPA: right-handed parallel beta-helix repeat-containing protein [Hanamia sp.]
MKVLITILLLFCFLQNSFATNYYLSNSGNDSNTGTSASFAWQNLSKLNSTILNAGDSVLFNRGDVFYGGIISANTGVASAPITYGAYGTGDKPIITGFSTVSGWTNKGRNIWESTSAVSTLPNLKIVVINGESTPMGRYPNGDASYPFLPNFYKFQSCTGAGSGVSSITSSLLNSSTDWTGADVVIRISQWAFHRELITRQSGRTLDFTGDAGGLESGWGFFIQNDIRTLDQQGEWYYNPSTKKISMYSTGMPTDVQVSTVDTLFNFSSKSPRVKYANIDNINFTGANTNGLFISGHLVFSVTNCNVSYSGFEGLMLYGGGILGGTIVNSTFYGNGSSGIFATGDVRDLIVTNNYVNVSGVISAYKQNDYSSGGLNLNAPGSLIQYNIVDSCAYCGINFRGSGIHVKNNFFNHSAMVRGDAAGIYTGFAGETGKMIDSNIVINSMGNPRGSGSNDYFAFGIYIDDLGTDISVAANTIVNCRTGGIYLHNSNHLKVRGNTIFNCGSLAGEIMWANGGVSFDASRSEAESLHDNVFTNNTIFAITPSQYALNYYAASGSSGEVSHFGNIDSNYYVKINSPSTLIKSQQTGLNGTVTLSSWQSFSAQDIHSKESINTVVSQHDVRIVYNMNNYDSTLSLTNKCIDVKGNIYDGSVTLHPYSSAVLIYAGKVTSPIVPTANKNN